jgi:cytidylate kinase
MDTQTNLERLARLWGPVEPRSRVQGPRVFVAGGQLRGKSTAAALVARDMGIDRLSGGAAVRRLAAKAGMTIEAMSHSLRGDSNADVRLGRCLIESAAAEPVVLECRMAGWIGGVLRLRSDLLVVTVLLQCSPTERALRWIGREVDAEQSARRRGDLAGRDPWRDFRSAVEGVVRLLPPELRPGRDAQEALIERDADDRKRLRRVYGVDFDAPDTFDLVIDGSTRSPAEVAGLVRTAVSRTSAPE